MYMYFYIYIISCICFRILFFENAAKDEDKPEGVAPKRTLDSLP